MGVMEKDGSIVNMEHGIDPKELEEYQLVRYGPWGRCLCSERTIICIHGVS